MPESVKDRCTRSHEYIFLLSKSKKYYFDAEAIAEPVADSTIVRMQQDIFSQRGSDRAHGSKTMKAVLPRFGGDKYTQTPEKFYRTKRNKRSVWTVSTKSFKEAHFATFSPELIEPCILAGCPKGGTVLDPFIGSGTTALVALNSGRNFIGIELNWEYISIAEKRIAGVMGQERMAL
jgi:tRNA G10  N-methylase Trm11